MTPVALTKFLTFIIRIRHGEDAVPKKTKRSIIVREPIEMIVDSSDKESQIHVWQMNK